MVQLSPDTMTGGLKGPGYAYEGDNAPGYSFEQSALTESRYHALGCGTVKLLWAAA
jgi:hypothetical protein